MIDYEIINKLPRFIPDEKFKEAAEKQFAIICKAPDEHPSGCVFMVISPEGERVAKFKDQDYAILFVIQCMENK